MTRSRRSPGVRGRNLLEVAFSAMLGLALILFSAPIGASHMHHGIDGHHPVTLHDSGAHQASHDAQHGHHEVDTWCGIACAMSVATLAERGTGLVPARGVPPAIMGRTDEHSPDDPLPPPRLEA